MNKEQIIEVLKSGNFTIAYHDSDYATIHVGKLDYEELITDANDELIHDYETCGQIDGYIPEIVQLLAEALGGKSITI